MCDSEQYCIGEIEEKLHYEKWYCGHYHTAKKIDKVEFMFDNFDEFLVNDSDYWENYNWCYECRENGDDFQLDENGKLVSRCPACSLKPHGDDK